MAIDLLSIEPSKISRDLSGYITYLYGAPKVGKTTLARDMGALIIATEPGTKALANAMVQPANCWADIKAIGRELKKPKVKEKFKAVALDTADAALAYCEKYVCSKNGVNTLGEVAWGGGWSQFKKEFENTFRDIAMQGYAVLFISHAKEKTIKKIDGTEYDKIVATATNSVNEIIKGMSDIIAFGYQEPETHERKMMLRSLDGTVDVGCRFQYIDPVIPFSYKSLEDALNRAIDKEEEMGGQVVNDRNTIVMPTPMTYEEAMDAFKSAVGRLLQTDENKYGPAIQTIIENHLGKGAKFNECPRDKVEVMSVIVGEIEELL